MTPSPLGGGSGRQASAPARTLATSIQRNIFHLICRHSARLVSCACACTKSGWLGALLVQSRVPGHALLAADEREPVWVDTRRITSSYIASCSRSHCSTCSVYEWFGLI